MKKLNLLVLSIMLFAFANSSFSQAFEFRVLASKGNNQMKASGDWKSLRVGSTLFTSNEVKVEEGGYLGLMHKSGKTLELKKPGVHKITALSSQLSSASASVASQYGAFLLSKMQGGEDGDVSASKLNNLNVTGAVSRASEGEDTPIFLPKSSNAIGLDDVIVKWKEVEDESKYGFYIDNLYGETIWADHVEGSYIDLGDLGMDLESEGGIFLRVAPGDAQTAGSYGINFLSGQKRKEILDKLNKLKLDLTNDDASLNKLILAMFYEEQKLYIHAFSCYHEVLREYPDVDFYKSAYLSFVERNKEQF